MTKNEIKEQAFGDLRVRSEVKYTHTDADGDNFEITCPLCMGNGYDIEIDGFCPCSTCEGLGSSSPVPEDQVTAYFQGLIALPV